MVIKIVRSKRDASEAMEQVILFVRYMVRADDADSCGAVRIMHLLEPPRDLLERIFPAGWLELPVAANERLADAFGMMREVKCEATFGAEEFAVDSRVVTIVGTQDLVVANAQGRLAAI